jgi:hypothetical protein
MECCEPGAIRDEELIAYLEGESVRSAVPEHLARCQSCSSRLATYQKLNRKLTHKLYRWECPSSQTIGEYHLGLIDSRQAIDVEVHIQNCVLCAAELKTLTAFLAADPMLEDRTAIAPRTMMSSSHYVKDIQQTVGLVREQALAGARRVMAMLLPSSVSGLAYQRSSGSQITTTAWPRDYQADDIHISLQLEPNSRQRGLLQLIGFITRQGQVVDVLQGVAVQLSKQAEYVETQYIDDLGNVVFPSLAPATYTLEITMPDTMVVVIDQIQVQLQD